MSRVRGLSRSQLAALVCETLSAHGIEAVLSGGSCVSIWSEELYVSNDLDMIVAGMATKNKIGRALTGLGFMPRGKASRYFVHPDTELALEFPSGPLMVGNEQVTRVEELVTDHGTLKLLSTTDCVKDRMAGFLHWNDEQNFQQALLVAQKQSIDWKALEKWFVDEGYPDVFDKFREAFNSANC